MCPYANISRNLTVQLLTSVRLHPDPPSACHTRHRTHTGTVGESAYGALVDTQHEGSLNDVGEGLHLLITEHCLEQREHTLCSSRVGRECEKHLRRFGRRWELAAVDCPPVQHLVGGLPCPPND
jgi:hypothetical protein|eukprot:6822940-Prymnesium_polylepis.1